MGSSNDNLVDKINRRNEEFWRKRQANFEDQIQDPEVVLAALGRGALEAAQKPFAERVSFVALVDQAHKAKREPIRDMARKGGKRQKPDALQLKIKEIVSRNPSITPTGLLRELKADMRREDSPIEGIDRQEDLRDDEKPMIKFAGEAGKPKEAPVSGLKDRLSRAKKASSR